METDIIMASTPEYKPRQSAPAAHFAERVGGASLQRGHSRRDVRGGSRRARRLRTIGRQAAARRGRREVRRRSGLLASCHGSPPAAAATGSAELK